MSKIKEHDPVILTRDLPDEGIRKGTVGTVIHVFTVPRLACEVEFCDNNGRTFAQLLLTPDQVEPYATGRGNTGQ